MGSSSITAKFGEHDRWGSSADEFALTTTRMFVHPKYYDASDDGTKMNFDICLLRFTEAEQHASSNPSVSTSWITPTARIFQIASSPDQTTSAQPRPMKTATDLRTLVWTHAKATREERLYARETVSPLLSESSRVETAAPGRASPACTLPL